MSLKQLLINLFFISALVVGGVVLIIIYSHWLVAVGMLMLIFSGRIKTN